VQAVDKKHPQLAQLCTAFGGKIKTKVLVNPSGLYGGAGFVAGKRAEVLEIGHRLYGG
jgi:hypothetical protein